MVYVHQPRNPGSRPTRGLFQCGTHLSRPQSAAHDRKNTFLLVVEPTDGIRLPILEIGDLGTSPFWGQLSVDMIKIDRARN
jgi:hypothetical protein